MSTPRLSTVRRARFDAKRHPEEIYSEEDEAIALARDRALNDLKPTPEYFAAQDNFALNEQVQMGGRQ